jgi:hypothetical protein
LYEVRTLRLFEKVCKIINGLYLLRFKMCEGIDAGADMPANDFSHLLHHDYAEREANNDGSSPSRSLWFHALRRKRQQQMSHAGSVLDCSMNTNTPSTSRYGLTSAAAPDEGVMLDPATGGSSDLGQEGKR